MQSQLRKRPSASFDPVVVHIDTELSPPPPPPPTTTTAPDESLPVSSLSPTSLQDILEKFRSRYPHFRFLRVSLEEVLELASIDWSALPVAPRREEGLTPAETLQDFFARLPSTTSKWDILRLFIRHILTSIAVKEDCRAVLLGCSTTALAELTLSETAKGRGFSLPWMTNDGSVSISRFSQPQEDQDGPESTAVAGNSTETTQEVAKLPVYYPNRELFRKELKKYITLIEPPLTDLLSSDSATFSSAVVSHKDVSIDEIMARYFTEVEENYPSIVANVVRTTAKLERPNVEEEDRCCGLCGMGLDELGNERWKGEIGDVGCGEDEGLCYGCSRAMRG